MVEALRRGLTEETPVTVIAFYAVTEGMPLPKQSSSVKSMGAQQQLQRQISQSSVRHGFF
jgi:hypothetical protein